MQTTEIFFIILFILIAIFFILIAIFYLARKILGKNYQPQMFNKKILLISVPRDDSAGGEDKKINLHEIQETIGIMETVYANISTNKSSGGIKNFLFNSDASISFEIVAKNGIIYFYAAVPTYKKNFIEQQLHAQYPDARIEEVKDYNIFSPQGYVGGHYLKLTRSSIFPIKTYKDTQSDPLEAITNILSKMETNDGAAIQVILKNTDEAWRKWGKNVVNRTRQGKSLEEAIKGGNTKINGWNQIVGSPKSQNQIPEKEYRNSPMEEEAIKKIEEKLSKSGLEVNIRIIVSADIKNQVPMYLENITNTFGQYNIHQYGNGFKDLKPFRNKSIVNDFIYRKFNKNYKMILNSEELAGIFHLPLQGSRTPNIYWLSSKGSPAPQNISKDGIVLGKNIYRGVETNIKIAKDDRVRHTYIIGKSGVGKSYLMANMACQDIANGEGVCVIDPHGDLIEDIISAIPRERIDDVVYFDPSDIERPMGLNLLEYDKKYPEQKTFVINEMIRIFDKLYDLNKTGGPMFEQYMRNAMLLIMDHPESGSTLMEISKVLAQTDFRKYKLKKCQNPIVRDFWQKEAEKAGGEASLANMVPYVTSKLTSFVANDTMRPIIGQQKSAFDFRKIMDESKILLVNLSKGKIGDYNAYLLGMVLVGKILMAALSRTDMPKEERKDFYLYIDEFQNFITESIGVILSEARKYRLNLIVAHQYIGQLTKNQDTSIRDAIFGNVGTIATFKVGADDAEFLAKEFAPVFNMFDLINIDKYNAYVKLLIDNQPSRAFNMKTLNLNKNYQNFSDQIKKISALKYGRDRAIVEEEILERGKNVEEEK